MEGDGPSFTTVTLDRLARHGIDTRSQFFVTGADAFRDIATWQAYPAILDRCHFVVVSRPGSPTTGLRAALPALSQRMIESPWTEEALGTPRVVLVDAPTSDVSSTTVRERVAAEAPLDGLVPAHVATYIARHGLYRPPAR
jgi:nicotinate-nucleotide adenylyltransferase